MAESVLMEWFWLKRALNLPGVLAKNMLSYVQVGLCVKIGKEYKT